MHHVLPPKRSSHSLNCTMASSDMNSPLKTNIVSILALCFRQIINAFTMHLRWGMKTIRPKLAAALDQKQLFTLGELHCCGYTNEKSVKNCSSVIIYFGTIILVVE